MSAEERVAPFASQVAAVARWLDGEGAAFLRRVSGRSGATHAWEFDLQHPVLRGRTRVKLVLPRGFPARAPRIMVDSALCLTLPHVEETGLVCLGTLSDSNAYAHPEQAVHAALAAFDEFLDRCNDIGWVTAEFERESLAYWSRFCGFSAKLRMRWTVRQLLNAVGLVNAAVEARVAIYESGRVGVAAGPNVDPNFLARRHGLARGTLELARAIFLPLPASVCWTPSNWPKTFGELAYLTHTATDGEFNLVEWCITEPKAPAAGFVVFTSSNSSFAYQLTAPMIPGLDGPGIVPVNVTRMDPDWAIVRDQRLDRMEHRRSKRVLVLGCGSLGAPLAIGLVKAGLQAATLVDMDELMPENVSRHPLGLRALFKPKAVELASQLNADTPGAVVKGHRAMAADWILAQCRPGDFDLVVDCTGEEDVRRFLSEVRNTIFPGTPIMHTWMEPFCAASHVVLIDKDTVWPADDPVLRIHAADWRDDTEIVLPACNAGFHEYGIADVSAVAAAACECVLSVLDAKNPKPSTVWSIVRSTTYFESLGVDVVPRSLVPHSKDVFHSVRLTRSLSDALALQEGMG
ncbi:ThiF family adenylyltransferase [Paraburkholderia sp. CNPSo 3076]|uniref:ThiF family adenylyltransferase n=1 Tax=Paraburkholderia sp. CNPSo 3076 TaxID=2940936 RepID=UPI00225806C4|nr:ThiF family adenylyltransferase [Paraburkholderia sp. CNPSo 3076]MCX5545238.1 ThiF family adenylyltransferase [Paraburkholderia sp. CNPSo 3076]